jgi:hypothetical protein
MAYKEFQNGFPLPASDLNNYLMNQSVIVFANTTERAAALTSPLEGMLTYIEDISTYQYWTGSSWVQLVAPGTPIEEELLTTTGDIIYASAAETAARLGIGTSGQVLTVAGGIPSWATPAVGSLVEWDYLGQTTPTTGVASVTFTGLTGYSKYMIQMENWRTSAAGSQFGLRINGLAVGQPALRVRASTPSMQASDSNLGSTTSSTIDFIGSIFLEFDPAGGDCHYQIVSGSSNTAAGNENFIYNFVSSKPTTSLGIALSAGTLTQGTYKVWGAN